MHTKDMLADALMKLGLMDMSLKARGGYYHDYLSPLDMPEIQLVRDLADAATRVHDRQGQILDLRERVMHGEFDASKEESDDWAASEEGQAAFRMLTERKPR
jgi:hypothetical protein